MAAAGKGSYCDSIANRTALPSGGMDGRAGVTESFVLQRVPRQIKPAADVALGRSFNGAPRQNPGHTEAAQQSRGAAYFRRMPLS